MQFLVTLILVGCVYSRTTDSEEYDYHSYDDVSENEEEVPVIVDAKMLTQSKSISVNLGEEVRLPCTIDSKGTKKCFRLKLRFYCSFFLDCHHFFLTAGEPF